MTKVSEQHKEIYHYTNLEGLKGILTTQSLWATNYSSLNDSTELMHSKKYIYKIIEPIICNKYLNIAKNPFNKQEIKNLGDMNNCIDHDINVFVDSVYRNLNTHIFILSFCGMSEVATINKNGLLSQWRGYGRDGGFMLVFDTLAIEELLIKEANFYAYDSRLFAKVIYDNGEKFKDEFVESITNIKNAYNAFLKKQKFNSFPIYQDVINIITRNKHFGFHEENEIRAICIPSEKSSGTKKIKFIKWLGNNSSTPYICINDYVNSPQLPIKKIVIGPSKNNKQHNEQVQMLIKNNGLAIPIESSDIPYI